MKDSEYRASSSSSSSVVNQESGQVQQVIIFCQQFRPWDKKFSQVTPSTSVTCLGVETDTVEGTNSLPSELGS